MTPTRSRIGDLQCKSTTISSNFEMLWLCTVLLLCFWSSLINCKPYVIPPVQFLVERHRFEAWIPDAVNVTFFAFHGRLNEPIGNGEPGAFNGELRKPENGRWVYKNEGVTLKLGDRINYWVFVVHGGFGYSLYNKQYTINVFADPRSDCDNSKSSVDGSVICDRALIFEDDFNGNTLDPNKWNVDHLIPVNSQNYEFVSYQNNERVVSVSGGKLSIRPNPHTQEDDIRGLLDIRQGCTGSGDECFQRQFFYQILPPVISGRIHSKKTFRYGRIEVNAKLPSGDWIYPQIRLTNPAENVEIWIAYARGNKVLKGNNEQDDLGARILFGGVAKGAEEPKRSELLRSWRSKKGTLWTDDFHNFTLIWEPSGLTLFVDGTQYGDVKSSEYKNSLTHEMHLTIGVGVGGINDFPDGYSSNSTIPKPWVNQEVKQIRRFFDAKDQWLPTWSDNSQLQIDFVKIYTLT